MYQSKAVLEPKNHSFMDMAPCRPHWSHFYGCKLQVQERMSRQIAEAVYSVSHSGAMVVVEANHICMISRGKVAE
jgi:hypothetical protein